MEPSTITICLFVFLFDLLFCWNTRAVLITGLHGIDNNMIWMLRHLWILLFRLIDLKSHWIRCVWYSWKNNISLTSLKIFRNWIYLLSKDQRKEVRKRSSGTELRQTTLCGFNQAAACLQCGGNPSQQSSSCSVNKVWKQSTIHLVFLVFFLNIAFVTSIAIMK